MIRWLLLALTALTAGCGGRQALGLDAGSPPDSPGPGDGPTVAEGAALPSCTGLEFLGQVLLDANDRLKSAPRIAWGGERFVVVWHSQPGHISSPYGELRLSLVDGASRTDTPDGISLGEDDALLEPALVAAPGEITVVHRSRSSGKTSTTQLRRLAGSGKTLAAITLPFELQQVALAPHPAGYAVLMAPLGDQPQVVIVDRAGTISPPRPLYTAQVMASLWLAPRPGGLVAGRFTTNANASLSLLDGDGAPVAESGVGHGLLVQSPAFAVLPEGFAAVYGTPGGGVESERFGAAGERLDHRALATAGVPVTGTGEVAAVWSGQEILVAYPGPVEGQYLLRAVDGSGFGQGEVQRLPSCMATSSTVSMAWGGQRLAVATISSASGLPESCICVTLLGCR